MFTIDITKIIITYISLRLLPSFFISQKISTTMIFKYDMCAHKIDMNNSHYLRIIFPNMIITGIYVQASEFFKYSHTISFSHILHIDISENSNSSIIPFLKTCHRLLSLTISTNRNLLHSHTLEHFTLKYFHQKSNVWNLNCPNLRILIIEQDNLNIHSDAEASCILNCPKLKALTFKCSKVNLKDIKQFTKLRKITFDECYYFSDFTQLGSHTMSKLKHITIIRSMGDAIQAFLSQCPNLQSLTISNSSTTNKQLMAILTTNLQLSHLKLVNCSNIKTVRIHANLKKLDLYNCVNLEDVQGLETNLKCINIKGCNKLTNIPRTTSNFVNEPEFYEIM